LFGGGSGGCAVGTPVRGGAADGEVETRARRIEGVANGHIVDLLFLRWEGSGGIIPTVNA
jgi:hypothetical protein